MMKNDEGRMPEWRVYVQQLRANEFCKNMNACVIYFNKKDKWKNGERWEEEEEEEIICYATWENWKEILKIEIVKLSSEFNPERKC